MRTLRLVAALLLVAGMVAGARAADAKGDANKEKLVGVWEVVKGADEGGPPTGATIEFAKDGKMKVTHKREGKEETIEGTFTVEGDKLSVTLKHEGKENKHTVTIKSLTATDLSIETEQGKKAELKKKK
jgi:uncharacterized protein (TIGR03066 family)